ncbi:MAG: ketoacyl-ACP synthase III, partial [Spirulina sp. SIO3F2]|nr:ketoacyl-ACP synthase III [Spirulina sp. SIO3F2]
MKTAGAGVAIVGSGSAIPETTLTNEQLSQVVETSDEWIRTRTGIQERHLNTPGDTLSELAAKAGERALAMAKLQPEDLDLIILATSTPDDLFGSAAQVQGHLGATKAAAFDLTAACSGFVFGLVTGAQFIRTGAYRNVLLIGADVLSRWVDWSDRRTCVLFGDGAGAVVLQANDQQDDLVSFSLHSDGSLNHNLNLGFNGGGQTLTDEARADIGSYKTISMNGREVYRFAAGRVPEVLKETVDKSDYTMADIDWLILHQANQRIIDAVAQRLDIPPERVISNVAHYGNTSAASIPLALDEAVRAGQIQPGQLI